MPSTPTTWFCDPITDTIESNSASWNLLKANGTVYINTSTLVTVLEPNFSSSLFIRIMGRLQREPLTPAPATRFFNRPTNIPKLLYNTFEVLTAARATALVAEGFTDAAEGKLFVDNRPVAPVYVSQHSSILKQTILEIYDEQNWALKQQIFTSRL